MRAVCCPPNSCAQWAYPSRQSMELRSGLWLVAALAAASPALAAAGPALAAAGPAPAAAGPAPAAAGPAPAAAGPAPAAAAPASVAPAPPIGANRKADPLDAVRTEIRLKNFAAAAEGLRRLAEGGNVTAQYRLGIFYLNGL